MAIVYGLVQQHGGMIQVDSEVGRGTSIQIDLPVARPTASVAAPASPHGDAPEMRGTETILLVEDDEALRRTAQRVLERSGYTVLPAADGEEALARYRQRPHDIDLVLTDVVMPNLDGLQLHRELERAGNRAPVLFVSGHPPSELRAHGGLADSVPVLQKPWTMSAILRKVRDTLDGRAA
jgi:CheY-like chemotaxis protein